MEKFKRCITISKEVKMKKATVYIAKDGSIYHNRHDCAIYDKMYECPDCKTTGIIKYEHRVPYPSGFPDSGWVEDTVEIREKNCFRCSGLGYLDTIPKELDPEYKKYLELKNKFKD